MSRVYITTSLVSKREVRLMERTTHSGLRYALFVNGVLKANIDNIKDAYAIYNEYAAM